MRGRRGVARQEIECAIARGWDDTRLAEHYRLEDIAATKKRMEEFLAEDPEPRKAIAECGTRTGFRRHWNNCEPACEPCRAAERAYQAAAHRRRKGQAA